MRNSSVFYSSTYLPTYLLLFVALSLMWSCEKEAVLEDFQAAPAEVEIAARKVPPIHKGGSEIECGGCQLVITALPASTTIEIRSFEPRPSLSNYTTAFLCYGTTPWLSATVSTSDLPYIINYAADDLIDNQQFQFAARSSGSLGTVTYTLQCFGDSSHGLIGSSNPLINRNATFGGNNSWGPKFPGLSSSMLGSNPKYDCPVAGICGIPPGPGL